MKNQRHAQEATVQVPAYAITLLTLKTEELLHNIAALHGAAGGVQSAIDNQTSNGYEIWALLNLIAKALNQDAEYLLETVTTLGKPGGQE